MEYNIGLVWFYLDSIIMRKLLIFSLFWSFSMLFWLSFVKATGDNFPQIIIDPVTKKIYVTTWYFQNTWDEENIITEETVGNPLTNQIITNEAWTWDGYVNELIEEESIEIEDLVSDIIEPEIVDGMSEFEQALAWMYANGLTQYNTSENYWPERNATREEVAKMMRQFYEKLGYPTDIKNDSCDFDDSDEMDLSLIEHIQKVCEWGIFKWSEGKYMPTRQISNPEIITVLIRTFQWKMSNEDLSPRRRRYYAKAGTLWLVPENDPDSFDGSATRKDIAVYMFRLKNIIQNDQMKQMWLNAVDKIDDEAELEANPADTNLIKDNLSAIASNIDASLDPELTEAVQWLHDNGLTMYETVDEYRPFDTLSREGASKMLDGFAKLFWFGSTVWASLPNECTFTDIDMLDDIMQNHVENICMMWLMKWSNNKFDPGWDTLKSQFVVALIRMFEGDILDETTDPRRKAYYEKAQELGIVWPADVITFDNQITRYEVALFLYRFKVKYQMMENLNSNKMQNEIISTMIDSETTTAEWLTQANIYVDTNLISDSDFEVGYVEILWNRYKVIRTATEKYFSSNYVRYGDLYDMVDDIIVWTVSFIMSNGGLIEWTVRISVDDTSYLIFALPDTGAYYKLSEIGGE